MSLVNFCLLVQSYGKIKYPSLIDRINKYRTFNYYFELYYWCHVQACTFLRSTKKTLFIGE